MTDVSSLLSRAEQLLMAGAYERAHAACSEALRVDPGAAHAYFMLGIIAGDYANYPVALELLDRAATIAPSVAAYHAHRGKILLALARNEDARTAALRAADLNAQDALTLDTIGVVFSRTGMHARAVPLFERAAALAPENASYWYNLAAAMQFLGRFGEAGRAYERAIARAPQMYKAYSALVQLKRQTKDENHLPALERLYGETESDRALNVGHAIAKTYEDMGEYDSSLDWLARAKAVRLREIAGADAADGDVFDAARVVSRATGKPGGSASDAPIFVVGLPRTGTTLVDRILSSHRDVASVGELGAFPLLVKQQAGTASNLVLDAETLRAANEIDFAALGEAYREAARPLAGDAAHFVDKMPLNFFYCGLIQRAFPNARIVALRRDAMDSTLSNYRQLFATSFTYYNYAFSLEDTARYVAHFDALMRHWRETLPADRFTEVSYESLVVDQERQTRRLLAFCGLEWDEACLSFHENAAPVATASSVQVRQPLYSSSMGRWRRYTRGLEGAKAVLKAAGLFAEES